MDTLALKHVLGRMWRQKEETVTPATSAADAAVLIVDDSRTVLRAFALMLEREGYLTIPAVDGQQAIYLAKRHKPDLILMDIVMPGVDGFRATRTLSNDPATRAIPVIMVSSKSQESDRYWGMRQGAVDFLVKPVTPAQLVEKAQAALLTG